MIPLPSNPTLRLFLLLLLLAICSASSLHAARKEALLIANSRYSHFPGLPNSLSDAAKLRDALEKIGFRVRLVSNASKEQMDDAVRDFENQLRNTGAIAFFHYGGHGVQVDGKNYLIPSDAEIPDENRVSTRSLPLEEVMAALGAARPRASIVVVDACRDNPLPTMAGRSIARGLSVVDLKPRNSIVIFSAEAGSIAKDGLFTPILAEELTSPGKTIDQIMKNVRREVYTRSQGQQTPGEYNQLFEDLFLTRVETTLNNLKDNKTAPHPEDFFTEGLIKTEVVRSPEKRLDYANVYWRRQYTLFDLITDEPIFPIQRGNTKVYHIYYSSHEDPRPFFGEFTAEELENHLFYKFKNKENCMRFVNSKSKH